MRSEKLRQQKRDHMRRKRSDPHYRRQESHRRYLMQLEREFPLLAGFVRARDKRAFIKQATALWRNAQ